MMIILHSKNNNNMGLTKLLLSVTTTNLNWSTGGYKENLLNQIKDIMLIERHHPMREFHLSPKNTVEYWYDYSDRDELTQPSPESVEEAAQSGVWDAETGIEGFLMLR